MRVKIINPTIDVKPKKLRVCAYCRVSTDNEEQLLSYENQLRYYQNFIENNPLYEFVGIYAKM